MKQVRINDPQLKIKEKIKITDAAANIQAFHARLEVQLQCQEVFMTRNTLLEGRILEHTGKVEGSAPAL